MLYSYLLTREGRTVTDAQKELSRSLDKSYELYISILKLMIDLTDYHDTRLDMAKNKYLPTEHDMNPNTRMLDNQFIAKLRDNDGLIAYLEENPISWSDDIIFMKLMHEKITNSDIYKKYMGAEISGYAEDCDFWKDIMKEIIFQDEDFLEMLESKSVYWNDDLDVMGTFVIKTIKQFAKNPGTAEIQPKYNPENADDSVFAEQLFDCAVRENVENNNIIDKFIQKEQWDAERIALMDRVILGVALSEIKNFDSIPTKVSMNEYIEIAKFYSNPKSGQFINGIMTSATLSS